LERANAPSHERCPLVSVAKNLSAEDLELYGATDPRDQPWYTYPEAARATAIPVSTLRAWTVGQGYRRKDDRGFFRPVISRPSDSDPRLSFTNIIEAHVLRALRTVHEAKLGYIREALEVAEEEFGIERLLISPGLRTSAGQLFLDRYTELLELSKGKQLTMRGVPGEYLQRVHFDESRLPVEFHPFSRMPSNTTRELISLSPYVSFGRALIRRVGVSTQAVAQRLEAGEPADEVMEDYGLRSEELHEAVLYEAAA
jgi:uncharacterized protein (DUF433 family)